MTKTSIPCFSCAKELENIFDEENHPMNGLEFITYGHYGSTFFDPMNGSKLIINICDECLSKNKKRIILK